jgi:predicted acetyltransferase
MGVERVEVAQAERSKRDAIASLVQLCLHDFSEIGSDYGEVKEDGKFRCDWLDSYWDEAERRGRVPFLIRADSHIAGFALINGWSALARPTDHSVAEFFVLRKYRRNKVGTRVAGLLFGNLPGRWEVPVAHYNVPALKFWRKVIETVIAKPAEEVPGPLGRWSGTVLCFETDKVVV